MDRDSVRIGVRMHDKETVERALEAYARLGSLRSAEAELGGAVSYRTIARWAAGQTPRPRAGRIRAARKPSGGKGDAMLPSESEKKLYEAPKSGPLAGLEPSQIENLLLRAVLDDLKAEGFGPDSISNRSKVELGERLRAATGLPLRSITAFLRISKSSYEYHRARLGADRHAELRVQVRALFEGGDRNWGYRRIWAELRRAGTRVSEKVVRRIMREEGLEVVYNKRRRRWSSYAGEVSAAPENLVQRDFHAAAPDELWLTDITEFRVGPKGPRVYLSAVVDCFDGKPVAWSIGPSPNARLANSSLLEALEQRREGASTVIHSDRGVHYRWPGWISICEENGLTRSMSAKGCSPDNAACEGFFGRLKNEFFHYRDWRGVTMEEFESRLEKYLEDYCEKRIKKSLGWMSPNEYRRSLGYAA